MMLSPCSASHRTSLLFASASRSYATAATTSAQPNPFEDLVRHKKFVCTECGKCCTGSGEVWVSNTEIGSMATALNNIAPSAFIQSFTKSYDKRPGWRLLKNKAGSSDCVFLEDGTKCRVYEARPSQVRPALYGTTQKPRNLSCLCTYLPAWHEKPY
jgi:hypothetical protein